ncbi:MAG: TPM domain-containing protein [Betaproteobacteria bacterium]
MRWWRHAITDRGSVDAALSPAVLDRIEQRIATAEASHAGQIVFAIEPALPAARVFAKLSPRDRALEVFGLLRVWDTEHNNGVLVYLLLADRDVEIVADRGIHRKVGDAAWQAICAAMEAAFRDGRYEEGALAGIEAISARLAAAFPKGDGPNELPNRPVVI